MTRDLTTLRSLISSIDHEILDILPRRMALSLEVAAYKTSQWLPVFDPVREKEILAHYADRVDFDITSIYQAIMDESKRLQREKISKK